MNNETMEWVKIGASLLGGGAMGAFITTIVANRRNRIQPIGTNSKAVSLFKPADHINDIVSAITLSGSTGEYRYDNLYLVQLELFNMGNKDYDNFKFGLTFKDASIVSLKGYGEDRHHSITLDQSINLDVPSSLADVTLTPFNRRDKYNLTLYVTQTTGGELMNFDISSPLPVKFTSTLTLSASLLTVMELMLKGTAIEIRTHK